MYVCMLCMLCYVTSVCYVCYVCYVCVYVCTYVLTYVCMYVCTYVRMYNVYTYKYKYKYICVCVLFLGRNFREYPHTCLSELSYCRMSNPSAKEISIQSRSLEKNPNCLQEFHLQVLGQVQMAWKPPTEGVAPCRGDSWGTPSYVRNDRRMLREDAKILWWKPCQSRFAPTSRPPSK